MRFDTPATTNPIDQKKFIGQAVERIDGRHKTTGAAPYAYEQHLAVPYAAYGYVVGAAIANAVYHATGVRVREYPLTLDKLLDQLPPI